MSKSNPKPKRKDFPAGPEGDKAFAKAMVQYEQTLKEEEAKNKPGLGIPPIKLPGITLETGIDDPLAKRWFKYSGATAKKGTQARAYYDSIVSLLQKAGVPKKKWQSAWDAAVDWVNTPGSGSTGDPKMYFNVWDPSEFTEDDDSGKQYGTTKSKQTTTTEYSTSAAASDITAAYKSELGREAGAADIAAYQKAVNKQAKGEPAVYTSTTTTAPGKGGILSTSTSTSKSQTGFDPTRFAIEYARSNPEYAENFAVRSFMKLIDQSLSDPNRIGQVVQ